jgi:hypothetical protein
MKMISSYISHLENQEARYWIAKSVTAKLRKEQEDQLG